MNTANARNSTAPPWLWVYGLVVLCAVVVLGIAASYLVTLLVQPLRVDLKLTDSHIGQLQGSVIAVAAALAAFPIGWLSDRLDRRWVLAGCVVVWSAATCAAGLAPNFDALMWAMVVLSVGEAALIPIIYAVTPRVVPARRLAMANLLVYSSIVLSGGAALALGGALYEWVSANRAALPWRDAGESWRLIFFIAGLAGPVVAVMLLLVRLRPIAAVATLATSPSTPASPIAAPQTYVDFLRSHGGSIVLIFTALGAMNMGWFTLVIWIPAVLSRSFGTEVGAAGVAFGSASMAATAVGVAAGLWWAARTKGPPDPVAGLRMVRNGSLAVIPVIVLMAWAPNQTVLLALTAIAIAVLVVAAAQAPTMMQGIAPMSFVGRTIALFVIVILPVRAGAPVAVGMLSDHFGADTPTGLLHAVVLVSLAMLLLAVLLLFISERHYARLVESNRRADGLDPSPAVAAP
ncbi:MFS transporter [Roseateles toxinivorans]|uniref:Putative MFS family arabinose efflux permease n=1 Tax=Roseateles toxinivorans TaxID=270368 RepID=A0A4R6QDS0_9BURK|nr:MFS transporter [Roseateles toxinivorans]TDP60460.1 putative MFS family arabinose efflux permease [Roseateles toxinivorans]